MFGTSCAELSGMTKSASAPLLSSLPKLKIQMPDARSKCFHTISPITVLERRWRFWAGT